MQFTRRRRTSHPAGLLAVVILLLSSCTSTPLPPSAAAQFDADKETTLTEQKTPTANDEAPHPDPKFSPEEVVGLVLGALQHNDTPAKDSGIRITFGFASPGNREMTGPLERFVELVKNPLYKPLLDHRRADRGAVKMTGEFAQQKVFLVDASGRRATYLFILSKQQDAPYKDCWMTDGVERLPDEDPDKDKQIAQGNGHLSKG